MSKIHEKSPCCRGKIRLFGTRRRQCSTCKKTWRVWKRKRGRNERRSSLNTLFQYFKGTRILGSLKPRTASARLRKKLCCFNKQTMWPTIPDGSLIAVADAMIEYIEKRPYAIYFILVRPINGSQAFILPPLLLAGGESGWEKAFEEIPADIFDRIVALVCDGHNSLVYNAKRFGWLLQRCHFHLLARIAHNVSFGPLGKNRRLGIRIQKLAHIVLYKKEISLVDEALNEIKKIKEVITSRNFRSVLSGFIKHYKDYRTYLDFPLYRLPSTSNSAEHLVGLVRDFQYRARGFRTADSLFAWVSGYCKYRKSVTCRPKIQPN